ncbi:MAG TPA: 5'-methylthioadenosine/S-adenosylhomocysteine nucleosidase [Clostridia bacterium]|nr:5'-methylthioadenosine/S-adenosylhomocysteine nucleosidase [Clostridia bacterium]
MPALAEAQPILIQGAMDLETSTMMEALEGAQTQVLHGYTFVTGTLDGYPVVISKTQVGMVNAATTTTIGILEFNPIAVINQGTAGGHAEALHKGDIVIGATTVNINSFKSDWAAAGAGIDPTKWINRTTEVYVDGAITGISELHSDPALVEIAKAVAYEKGSLVEGVIGSGDVWNKELDRIALIHEQFDTACEEMETFAVAQVCSYMGTPFLGIRILSNNEIHEESFDPATGPDCQNYVLDVARAMIKGY